MLALVILALVASPFLALVAALFRGLVLAIPVALVSGWCHSRIGFVPDLNLSASFFAVTLLSLLIPTGDSGVKTSS